jgi:hypothetical protein
VADAFHGEVPGPVWPDEDSHSPWTEFWGPRQCDHLFRSASGIEISGELRVTIRMSAEMIQGIQQGLRGRFHAGSQVMEERYQDTPPH